MKQWLFMINYFAHDFFSGFWLACFIVLAIVYQQSGLPGEAVADGGLVTRLLIMFFWLQSISLGLIAVTGYLRSLDAGDRAHLDARKTKQFLIIKHAVLGVFFIGGTVLGYQWAMG